MPLNGRPKLEVLDALRGVCALAVMLLHLTEMMPEPYHIVPHAYLPVAYFFVLTGFTFVYAYDGRWGEMTVGAFFRRRLLRMHPLVVVGSVVGLVAFCLMPGELLSFGHGGRPSVWFIFIYSCLLLPAPATWGCIHVLQGQLWTLQYIYLANVLYALVLRHLKTWMLAVLSVASAWLSWRVAVRYGGLEAGWLLKEDHVTVALVRMAFPVLAGMFIARSGWKIPLGRLALPVTALVLCGVFAVPHLTGLQGALFDTLATVVVMPLVLMIGAGGRIGNARVAAVCRWLGAFSFPLYVTHYQFRSVMMRYLGANPGFTDAERILVIVGTGVIMLVFAWAAMKSVEAFDRHFRRKM